VFTPVLAKHTKSFNLVDTLSVGVDRIQRNFEPLQRQVEGWRQTQITDERAKLIFYSALSTAGSTLPRVYCPTSTGSTSNRSIRNSRRGQCGACRTRSPAPSKSLVPNQIPRSIGICRILSFVVIESALHRSWASSRTFGSLRLCVTHFYLRLPSSSHNVANLLYELI